jgi:argininosuccinate lyase
MAGALATLRVNVARMREAADDPLLLATDLAEALVREGVPFREAHEAVGKIVAHCVSGSRDLRTLSRDELRGFHPSFSSEAAAFLSVERALEGRAHVGGTARARVSEALDAAQARLVAERTALAALEAAP